MKYTLKHFIDKFEKIPYEDWTTRQFCHTSPQGKQQFCALGHCGQRGGITTPESSALTNLMQNSIVSINDGWAWPDKWGEMPTHPKDRTLFALRKFKETQCP